MKKVNMNSKKALLNSKNVVLHFDYYQRNLKTLRLCSGFCPLLFANCLNISPTQASLHQYKQLYHP
jgi:hypothetical protein